MKVLNFNDFLNENDVYGKYNTIKKVRAVLGKSPSDEEIAQFIKQNYKEITGEDYNKEEGYDHDKVADIIAFYKVDTDTFSNLLD